MKFFKKLWSLARRLVSRVRQSQLVHELAEVSASHWRDLIRAVTLVVDNRIRHVLPAPAVPFYDIVVQVVRRLFDDEVVSCLVPPRVTPQGAF